MCLIIYAPCQNYKKGQTDDSTHSKIELDKKWTIICSLESEPVGSKQIDNYSKTSILVIEIES